MFESFSVNKNSKNRSQSKSLSPKKLFPLVILASAIIFFFVFDLGLLLSFEIIASYREHLVSWHINHQTLMILSFMGIYVAMVVFSLPGAVWLTLVSGFIFGAELGTLISVFSATIGALLLFVIARYALSDYFHDKIGTTIQKMENGFKEDAFSYLIALRLIPLFPFWLVNLVPALLGVPLKTFFMATFLGIIPGSFIYAIVGTSINELIKMGKQPNFNIIFEPKIMGALVGLAILSLIPIFYKKYKVRSGQNYVKKISGDSAKK
jgi:uncharacterized membrane protein YdjX (TVP38/TMEM64 family)